jgi:hypothetical protein
VVAAVGSEPGVSCGRVIPSGFKREEVGEGDAGVGKARGFGGEGTVTV